MSIGFAKDVAGMSLHVEIYRHIMKPVLIASAVVLLIAGWFFISPLFIDQAVNENFSFANSNGQFNLDCVMAMPEQIDQKLIKC